jgi:uncharacterized membrane protein YeaQ/YmgE (transglycosylase-associated protein family)
VGIIGWLLFGLVAGALARLFVPGRDPMGRNRRGLVRS